MHLKFAAIITTSILAVGCESTSEQRFASYETERKSYFECGFRAGKYLRRRDASLDSYTLENSSRALCGKERAAVIDGVMNAHGSGAWRGIMSTFDQKFAEAVSLGSIKG